MGTAKIRQAKVLGVFWSEVAANDYIRAEGNASWIVAEWPVEEM